MKRFGGLIDAISAFDNCLLALKKASAGKKKRPDVLYFNLFLENELTTLSESLSGGGYLPGGFRVFIINDTKVRLISAAPFKDRVVHHAICNIIEPIFDKTFISDSYANRHNRGAHKALNKCSFFCRKYQYFLKCDIEKYFPSIDHEILKRLIRKKIKCTKTLRLLDLIIDNSNEQEKIIRYFPGDDLFTPFERKKGIPIGNLTSQLFANIYLNSFDHFCTQKLKLPFIRFADDFIFFGSNKTELNNLIPLVQNYLDGLRLALHPKKCRLAPVSTGVNFLGWQVFPCHRKIKRNSGVRIRKKMIEKYSLYRNGILSKELFLQAMHSWNGHLSHGDTFNLRKKLYHDILL